VRQDEIVNMTVDERRRESRVDSIVVVEVASGEKAGRFGVTHNASEHGLLIATRTKFKPGDYIELVVHGHDRVVHLRGHVVRVEETPPTFEWRYRAAIELDEPLPKQVIQDGTEAATRLLRSASGRPQGA
jgi:hypothetical protein